MKPDPGMIPQYWTVRDVAQETADSFSLGLEPPPGYGFEPGQFNQLYLFGKGEAPISISSDPARKDRLVHSIRAVGVVTNELQRLCAGDRVGVRGPFGRPWPLEAAYGKDVLLVAGGIGLAPLRPLIYQILARRERFNRVYLLYGARTPRDLLYAEELASWKESLDLRVTVDRVSPGWTGQVGVVPKLIGGAALDPAQCVAYICGPEVMMRFSVEELSGLGIGDSSIFLSLERNMKCAQGYCGHCQLGPYFVCRDGPVFSFDQLKAYLLIRGG